jgi:hypothetical protein
MEDAQLVYLAILQTAAHHATITNIFLMEPASPVLSFPTAPVAPKATQAYAFNAILVIISTLNQPVCPALLQDARAAFLLMFACLQLMDIT